MPTHRSRPSYRVGNDYERVPGTGEKGIPADFQIKRLWRTSPRGGRQLYTPPNKFYDKSDVLEKLAQVRTRKIRLDLVGSLRKDGYKPDDYQGFGIVYLSRNLPQDVLYLYELIATTTGTTDRIRDLFNTLTGFNFAVIEEVRFVERGHPQNNPVLARRYAADKKAGRF